MSRWPGGAMQESGVESSRDSGLDGQRCDVSEKGVARGSSSKFRSVFSVEVHTCLPGVCTSTDARPCARGNQPRDRRSICLVATWRCHNKATTCE